MKRVGLAALILAATACQDAPHPVAPPVNLRASAVNVSPGVPIPGQYIVVFKDDVQDVDGAARSLASKHAGKIMHTYKTALRGTALQLSDAAVTALRADPRVAYVEQDQEVHAVFTQSGATWGLDRIDQRALPLDGIYTYYTEAANVTAYIIDTGINFSHPEYVGRATKGIDEVTIGGGADDCNGHGSHVAGTVGGTTYGVAKKVSLVAVRVLDCSGSGSYSGVIAGVDWVTTYHAPLSVANMSLGGGYSAAMNTAVQNSIAAGVTYAIAAGNSTADACTFSPASATGAITVGATDIGDGFASFSNYGTCVKINAPGVGITSAWLGTGTNTISGTSMASPHVAGAAALYLSVNTAAKPADVLNALTANATPNVVTGLPGGTPNLLLYSAFIGAGPPPPPVPPVANFTWTCSGLTCSFNGSSSTGPPTTYSWDFGVVPPATGSGVTTSYTYAVAGTYNVTLTVTNGLGTNSKTQAVSPSAAPPPPPPTCVGGQGDC